MMMRKRQIHDGIAGGLITLGVLLGVYVSPSWLWLPGILGATLLQSGFTDFLPGLLHFGSNLSREERNGCHKTEGWLRLSRNLRRHGQIRI